MIDLSDWKFHFVRGRDPDTDYHVFVTDNTGEPRGTFSANTQDEVLRQAIAELRGPDDETLDDKFVAEAEVEGKFVLSLI